MVIVIESPNKRKSIAAATGARVIATFGHFKDLPKNDFAVDLANNYTPSFTVLPQKSDFVDQLKAACKGQDVVIATDPDREGYAIGTMVFEDIKALAHSIRRAEIHEITDKAIKTAISTAVPFEQTNRGLYDAFLGRRVGDRIVGYILSPMARNALAGNFSVGRVQSPALHLVMEREREIRAFTPLPYWVVSIQLAKEGRQFRAYSVQGRFEQREAAEKIAASVCAAQTARCMVVEKSAKKSNPPPPFSFVTLAAAASSLLGFTTERTMKLAQELFEGGSAGHGFITYPRTDSVRIADEFLTAMREFIQAEFGSEFLSPSPVKHVSKNSQAEAHEAIRPTTLHPLSAIESMMQSASLSHEHSQLYELIVRRVFASQAAPATFEATKATFLCAGEEFRATGRVLTFAGWLAIMAVEAESQSGEEDEKDQELPPLAKGEDVPKFGQEAAEKRTRPPGRYSEKSLLEKLESLGIGRPSTYPAIFATLKGRGYVTLIKKQFAPTPQGEALDSWLVANHPWIVEYNLTRRMEEYLDRVAGKEAGTSWQAFAKGLHARTGYALPPANGAPSKRALNYARDLAHKTGVDLPEKVVRSAKACREWIHNYLTMVKVKNTDKELSGGKRA